MFLQFKAPISGVYRDIFLLLDVVVRDLHLEHFESFFRSLGGGDGLSECDFDDSGSGEFEDVVDFPFSKVIVEVDFFLYIFCVVVVDIGINTEKKHSAHRLELRRQHWHEVFILEGTGAIWAAYDVNLFVGGGYD